MFRVIGFGQETAGAIDKIKSSDYESTEAFMADSSTDIAPLDGDHMVILLAPKVDEAFLAAACKFSQARVLTLGVVAEAPDFDCSNYAILSVTKPEKFAETVDTVLYPLSKPNLIALDFMDIATGLHEASTFTTATASAQGENRIKEAIDKAVSEVGKEKLSQCKRLIINVRFDPESATPTRMSEMQALADFAAELDDDKNVIWGVSKDSSLPEGFITVSLLAS